MLRWSRHEHGESVDLDDLAACADDAGKRWSRELFDFATSSTGHDGAALDRTRAALVARAGEAAMVDAAAVIANFEMMTRLADGTGARIPQDRVDASAGIVRAFGMADVPSRR